MLSETERAPSAAGALRVARAGGSAALTRVAAQPSRQCGLVHERARQRATHVSSSSCLLSAHSHLQRGAARLSLGMCVQAFTRRNSMVAYAAQKAEYIWYDGMEGDETKVRIVSPRHTAETLAQARGPNCRARRLRIW